jgi:hypothetical protein
MSLHTDNKIQQNKNRNEFYVNEGILPMFLKQSPFSSTGTGGKIAYVSNGLRPPDCIVSVYYSEEILFDYNNFQFVID